MVNKSILKIIALGLMLVFVIGCTSSKVLTKETEVLSTYMPEVTASTLDLYTKDKKTYEIELDKFNIDNSKKNSSLTTKGINQALEYAVKEGYNKVVFPKGEYLIKCEVDDRHKASESGIIVPSNIYIDLKQASFFVEPNESHAYTVLNINEAENIIVEGGKFVGDRDEHIFDGKDSDKSHEYGHGIVISASKNITIMRATILDMTGDGIILIGYGLVEEEYRNNIDIILQNNEIFNCRRQGISVTNAQGGDISYNIIHGINGTPPQYGIDIEVELDSNATGLKVHRNTIYDCAGGGISAHSGSGYDIFSNILVSNGITAVKSKDVNIYNNMVWNANIDIQEEAEKQNVIGFANILK